MFRFFAYLMLFCVSSLPANAQKSGPQGPVPVFVTVAMTGLFADSVEALGTTKANESVVITADTAEKVAAIHFEDGQKVKKGDLLVTLDKGEEDASLNAAMAMLSEAESSYERAQALQNNKALSKGTFQERLATLKQSQAAVEEIKARIEKLDIRAPFDGVLGLRDVSVGALVQPGQRITTLDDLKEIKVDFDVPAVFLSSLKPGLPIIGRIEAFGNREFHGTVKVVDTQVDPVTRTVRARAVIPNEDGQLKPGLLMSLVLLKNQRQALLIPEEAIIKRGDDNFVFSVHEQDGKTVARQTRIRIGVRQPGRVEILSGLKEGDAVISHGLVKVRDGAEINVRANDDSNMPLTDLLKGGQTPEAQ